MFSGVTNFFGAKQEDDVPVELDIKSQDILVVRSKFTGANIIQMRQTFPGLPDDVLAKYLIARNNDFAKASEQLTKALKWRADNMPILKTSCLKEINSGKLYVHGVDKEGRPLLIFRSRKSFPKERDIEETIRMLVWFGEHLAKRFPPHLSKYTLLIDRTDHVAENADQDLMKHASPIFQDIFPETVNRVIIYPSDVLFYTMWSIVKWFIDPVTREKVQPMMMLSGVEQFIDKSNIPKCMGGDDEYEYNPDDYSDPYSAEEMEKFAANGKLDAATAPTTPAVAVAVAIPAEGEANATVFTKAAETAEATA